MRRVLALGLGLFLAIGCGPAASALQAPATGDPLTIPVAPGSRAALADLERRAATDPQAAWQRLHYLLDLFDDARYRADDDSLRLLSVALGEEVTEPPLRGPLRTDRVIAALRARADAIAESEVASIAAARTLLTLDAGWPRRRAQVPSALAPVIELAAAGSALSGNAALRLHGYCTTALRDAIRAAPSRRPAILGHCLYALGRPEQAAPHFAEGAAAPALAPILAGLDRLLEVAAADPRLAPAAARQRALLASLLERHRSALDEDGEHVDGGAGRTQDSDP